MFTVVLATISAAVVLTGTLVGIKIFDKTAEKGMRNGQIKKLNTLYQDTALSENNKIKLIKKIHKSSIRSLGIFNTFFSALRNKQDLEGAILKYNSTDAKGYKRLKRVDRKRLKLAHKVQLLNIKKAGGKHYSVWRFIPMSIDNKKTHLNKKIQKLKNKARATELDADSVYYPIKIAIDRGTQDSFDAVDYRTAFVGPQERYGEYKRIVDDYYRTNSRPKTSDCYILRVVSGTGDVFEIRDADQNFVENEGKQFLFDTLQDLINAGDSRIAFQMSVEEYHATTCKRHEIKNDQCNDDTELNRSLT